MREFNNPSDYQIHIPSAHLEQLDKLIKTNEELYEITQEECAELIQAISKYKRKALYQPHEKTLKGYIALHRHIVEELTHVSIMLALLKARFGITQDEIDEEIMRKANDGGFDTSEYGFKAERRSENRDIGAEAARALFPQCFEDATPMKKKYILTDEIKVIDGHIVRRIQALKSFRNVNEGDLGGWIEKEENLSHEGGCWVYDEAAVYGEAKVFEWGKVYGKAEVFGETQVYGEAQVFGEAKVYEKAEIFGRAKVHEKAEVFETARIYEKAKVYGKTEVYGRAEIFGEAKVHGETKVFEWGKVYGKAEVFGEAKVRGEMRAFRDKYYI